MRRVPLAFIPAVLTLLIAAPPASFGGKLYKWQDEDGNVRYGDSLPGDSGSGKRDTLNEQGLVINRAKPDDGGDEQQDEAGQDDAELRRARMLLSTFSSTREISRFWKRKRQAVEAAIATAEHRITSLRRSLDQMIARAARYERAGKPVPKDLTTRIDATRQRIAERRRFIKRKRQEKAAIRRHSERDVARYRELQELIQENKSSKAE